MAAIFFTSVRPPAWQRSGWMMSAACRSRSSRKRNFVVRRSPVATGISMARATVASASKFSGGTGSS